MATSPARYTWAPTPRSILALAALVIFIIDALAFGHVVAWNGHFLLALGMACLAGAWVL